MIHYLNLIVLLCHCHNIQMMDVQDQLLFDLFVLLVEMIVEPKDVKLLIKVFDFLTEI